MLCIYLNKYKLNLIMKKEIIISGAIAGSLLLLSQMVKENYNDVLLVINKNSNESTEIGNYFRWKRNIPKENVLLISTTTEEVANATEYHNNILTPIKNYLSTRPYINYIVTTKGVPLVIVGDDEVRTWYNGKSTDSMLTILNEYEAEGWTYPPPAFGWQATTLKDNAYFDAKRHFTSRYYSMYLVTRLTGYTVEGIKSMIDRSTNTKIGVFVFVDDPNPIIKPWRDRFLRTVEMLRLRGYNVIYENTGEYLKNQENVTGYGSWGDNHSTITGTDEEMKEGSVPHNTWTNGSIAEVISSTSARTFIKDNWNRVQLYRQTMIGDLLENGLTGAHGWVTEPLTGSVADPLLLYRRYTVGFNMAESFYASIRYVNWKDVIIGDPKMRIR
ncbi:MAG: TIGR03790 family protein [Candidatus Heimdallarchaeaceae archaeon]